MLVHSVYFWLKPELSAAQRAEFRKAVEALGAIKDLSSFYVGGPAGTERRAVIDFSFDVALTTVFENVAAHDAYQVDPIHAHFLTTYKDYWAKVQIYDAE